MTWGIKWRSECKLDGRKEYLMGSLWPGPYPPPPQYSGFKTAVFKTRAMARAHIKKHYGYIKDRPDLRREPHGWKMPIAVQVDVIVMEWI